MNQNRLTKETHVNIKKISKQKKTRKLNRPDEKKGITKKIDQKSKMREAKQGLTKRQVSKR
jgi:hypothetical protein